MSFTVRFCTFAASASVLADSHGRPRIVLKVAEHDQPTITILGADGNTVKQLA